MFSPTIIEQLFVNKVALEVVVKTLLWFLGCLKGQLKMWNPKK